MGSVRIEKICYDNMVKIFEVIVWNKIKILKQIAMIQILYMILRSTPTRSAAVAITAGVRSLNLPFHMVFFFENAKNVE
jgi:hypothetical protein